MSINRRALLGVASAAAFFTAVTDSFAQSISPPQAEDLAALLRGDPKELARMLAGVDALTHVLVLRLAQSRGTAEGNLARWFEIRRPFSTPAIVAQVGSFATSAEAVRIVQSAGEAVRPTAAKIEQALAEGGLLPGKELERDMLRGFYQFVQLKAVVDQKVMPARQAWYCEVYPFSIFCTSAG